MRIIIGTESYPPHLSGVAVHVKNLSEYLSKKHKIYIITPNITNNKELIEKINDNLIIYRTKSIKNPFRKNHRISIVDEKYIENILKEINPQIIHIHDCWKISSKLLKLSKKYNIPIIATHHFDLNFTLYYLKPLFIFHNIIKEFLKRYLVKFYNQCNLIITPSNITKKTISNWGVKTKIEAVSNGVDIKKFYPTNPDKEIFKKFKIPSKIILLYLGRIDKEKRIDLIIKSAPLVLKKFDVHFVIAGFGSELKRLKKLSIKLGIKNNITFTGKIKRGKDIENIYRIAKIFIIPSQVETQSIVTLEAMASGLPIIASNSGALPELVKNGYNGLLFKGDNYKDLADKIIILLKDKKLRKIMSKNSRKIAEKHDIKKTFKKIEKIYKEIGLKNY